MDLERMQQETGPCRSSLPLPIHRIYAEVARIHGDKPALVHAGGSVSYRELDTAANRIAAHLIARSIGPGAFVALHAEASPAAIIAILGILKSGAAYLPLDPAYPANLLAYIRQDSSPAATLVSRRQSAGAGEALVIEDLLDREPALAAPGDRDVAPDELAYVMYTSGSTGRPKGVMVPHQAVVRLVVDADYASLGPDKVFLQQAPLAFDAATFEIWGALLNGGTLAIPSGGRASLEDIATAIRRFGVTTLWLTAGLFHLMVDHQIEGLSPLRQLLAGGDVLSGAHVRKFLKAVPSCRLINGYGPTENTTFSCCYTVPAEVEGERIPIGKPINGTTAYVLDEARHEVAAGESGELHVGGRGVALGYLNQSQLTAEKFVPNPFGDGRLYRTGDLVRRRPDGNLEFLGRIDRQVKINGKRIELDEIEATVRRSGFVRDAAAVVTQASGDIRRIALFVTPVDAAPVDLDRLHRFIAEELPDYMMPAEIRSLAALPLSPTGKVDRSTLIASAAPVRGSAPIVAAGETARQVQAAWGQALGIAAFGLDDNFFDLGGTSLQLVGMHAALQQALGRAIPLMEMFSHPTVRSLAARLDGSGAVDRTPKPAQDMAAKRNASLARARLSRGMTLS